MNHAIELAPNFYRPRVIRAWNYLELGSGDRAVEQCANVIEEIGGYFDPKEMDFPDRLHGED